MFENGRVYHKPSEAELVRAHGRLSEFVNGTITVIPVELDQLNSTKVSLFPFYFNFFKLPKSMHFCSTGPLPSFFSSLF